MLIGIFGDMGSGKTLLANIYANKLQEKGLPIYSNMKSLSIKTRYINNLEEIGNLDNAVVILDEFWLSVDSRLWKNNISVSRWLMQTRKKNLLVFFTTQAMHQVDLRLRGGTALLIYCEKLKKKGYFRHTYISGSNYNLLKITKMPFREAERYYTTYDTYEVLEPMKRG